MTDKVIKTNKNDWLRKIIEKNNWLARIIDSQK